MSTPVPNFMQSAEDEMNATYNNLGYSAEETAIATGVVEDKRGWKPLNQKQHRYLSPQERSLNNQFNTEFSPLKGKQLLPFFDFPKNDNMQSPTRVDFAKKKKEFYVSIYSNRTSPVKATNIIDKINNNQILVKDAKKSPKKKNSFLRHRMEPGMQNKVNIVVPDLGNISGNK